MMCIVEFILYVLRPSQHLLDLGEEVVVLVRAEVPVGQDCAEEGCAEEPDPDEGLVGCFPSVELGGPFSVEVGQSGLL
jgi:hypothetical protein